MSDTDQDTTILELDGLSKFYPGVRALVGVSARLKAGSVLGVVGENGAGKTTMLSLLAGLVVPDEGRLLVDGKEVHFNSHADALAKGIEIVPQEVSLVPEMTVAENICLGDYQHGVFRRAKRPQQVERARSLAYEVGLKVEMGRRAGSLSLAQQRLLIIARALARGSRVLILDEPSVGLEPGDIEQLLSVVARLRSQGIALAYCSHDLREIETIADEIMVLRDGHLIWSGGASDVNRRNLITMIAGEDLETRREERSGGEPVARAPGEVLLEVDSIDGDVFNDVSLTIRAGEIVGLAGLTGSGRSEILHAIAGAESRSGGTMKLRGRDFSPSGPREAIRSGLCLMPEDRRQQALVPDMTVRANASLARFSSVSKGIAMFPSAERSVVGPLLSQWRVRPPDTEKLVSFLSGGNQQKVLFVRLVLSGADVVLLDEPTSGVDVGARDEIHQLIQAMAADGKGVLVVSSDLEELSQLVDRALVLRQGHIVAELKGNQVNEANILDHCYSGDDLMEAV